MEGREERWFERPRWRRVLLDKCSDGFKGLGFSRIEWRIPGCYTHNDHFALLASILPTSSEK